MKQQVFRVAHLHCAHCGAKIEERIAAHPSVSSAALDFGAKTLRITARDPEKLLPELNEIAQSVEAEVRLLPMETPETREKFPISLCVGAGLFLAGLALQSLAPWHIPLYVLAYLFLGWEVLVSAVKNLRRGNMLDENFLMTLAALGAFAIGEYPEAVGILLFYRIGEYFEEKAVQRSRKQIMEAVDLRPETVLLENGLRLPAEDAQVGERIRIRPGDRIPLDGVVVSGESRVDTAPITGEPVPVSVRPGSSLISGCVNTTGDLVMVVEKPLSQSMVTRILQSVESAAAGKPRAQRFITRFSAVYTPVVVGIAAAVALVPSFITGQWSYWIYTALSFLVMSCPCALVLSVPLAFFSGIGVGSRRGILFKNGASMEALAEIQGVAMDKTGTLTEGKFAIRHISGDILPLCAACERHSTHPIAQSILEAARGLTLPEVTDLGELPGLGVVGQYEGKTVLCGNEKLLERHGVPVPETENLPGTRVYLAWDGEALGWLSIADALKPEAERAVSRLKRRGLEVAIFTGDRRENAQAAAEALGISRVCAGLLPEEKLEALKALRREMGRILFVGDGINDAPVLSGADVGCAMGSGADAALEAADVVVLNSSPEAVAEAVDIAARTRRIARQNVVFALGVKLAVMILGLTGHASMWAAVFADSGVAMLCVLNSVRMLYRPVKKS